MNEKMNLLDFQRKFQGQYGVSDQDMDRIKKVHLLTFFIADSGALMAKLPKGGVVFPHRDGGLHIAAGETWVCEVLERGTTFFAIGMLKLDGKFFFDLRADQVDQIAAVMWKENQSILEPRFEEMYRQKLEETLTKKLQESKKKEEEALARVEELKSQIDAVNTRNSMVVSALEKELAETREKAKSQIITVAEKAPAPQASGDLFSDMNPHIHRISPDELYSEDFRHRNYFVHVSSDQSLLTIRPHERGNVVCLDNRITLNGLGLISPYNGPSDMPAVYNPKYGGYMVYLKYIPSTGGA